MLKKHKNTINLQSGFQAILTDVLQTQHDLMIRYYDFWQNIFYNDAYVFFKHAIFLLKNQQNNKFHGFFSGFINKILWNGQCDYMVSDNPDWITKTGLHRPEPSAFCKLGLEAIRSLDEMFNSVCPRLINHLTVYRGETLPRDAKNTNNIIHSSPGDYIRFSNYLCTTINPNYSPSFYCGCMQEIQDDDTIEVKKKKDTPDECALCIGEDLPILYIMELPPNTTGYYINIPFSPLPHMSDVSKKDANGVYLGHNEYEFVLPRGCVFEIISNKIDYTGVRRIIHIKLIKQLTNYPSPKEDEPTRDLDKVFKNPLLAEKAKSKKDRDTDNSNIELVDIYKHKSKLPNEYNQCLELAKYHGTNIYHINAGFMKYIEIYRNVQLFNNSLLKILPCNSLQEITRNRNKYLAQFYRSLHHPTVLASDKFYMCLLYHWGIPEIYTQLNTAKKGNRIELKKTTELVLTRNIEYALLNSLLLFNFYKEEDVINKELDNNNNLSKTKLHTNSKTNSQKPKSIADQQIKISEVYTTLLSDYPLFFLIEIDNINSFNQNKTSDANKLYELDSDICVLSLVNKKDFEKNECVPSPNNYINIAQKIAPYKLHVNSVTDKQINTYKYRHITCNLVN